MFSPLTACHPAAVTAATAFLALPSSSVGALVAGSAQAQPPPPRTVAYPLWRTMTTTRRGLEDERRKQKGGRGVLTACRHYRRHRLPRPPFLLRGRASRGRSRPGTHPAASDRGIPTVEDNDNDEEGG